MWWRFREALDPEGEHKAAIPPDRKLAAELGAPIWRLRGNRILIESKDDTRRRLGSSTDRADALILEWHGREDAAYRRVRQEMRESWQARRRRTRPWDPYGIDETADPIAGF